MNRTQTRRIFALALCLAALPWVGSAQSELATAKTLDKLQLHQPQRLEDSTRARFLVALTPASIPVDASEMLRHDYDLEVLRTFEHALSGLLVECDLATARRLAAILG